MKDYYIIVLIMASLTITNDNVFALIADNKYINTSTSNKKKDVNSLSYLIDRIMSQSDCIKLGIACENVFTDFILKYSSLVSIKKENKLGKKETDHLFIDNDKKIIYYAELKGNLNLDTEKSKSTYNKCLDIVKELEQEYEGYEIKWCLLGLRVLDYKDIPSTTQKKYTLIKSNLFGINQYLEMLNIDYVYTEENYKLFLNTIVNTMISD